ncbi:DUF1775 domain-containing protein [Micromonospora sp. NPDC094482]|uniref:DUF1775 domain-containing protein n=1 Tax=unclassified Micromonospora TaxID=2617518 RepID=UPI00331CB592
MAMTDGNRRWHRPAALAALAAATVLGWPGTAHAAEVTTNPGQARQGDAVRLEFVVPEERPGTRTRQIEVRLPADAPIAEVYPMSVPGWAPRISSRTLDQPVAGIHSTGVTTVTTAVTWIRVDGAPAGPARLALSMGPLPRTDRLTFPVIQTYADGTVVRWADPTGAHRAPVLTLLPAAAGAPAGHTGHGGAANGGAANGGAANGEGGVAGPAGPDPAGARGAVDGAAGARAANEAAGNAAGGNADALLAAGLLAGLGGGAAIGWLASRWRRRSPTADPATTEPAESAEPTEPTGLASGAAPAMTDPATTDPAESTDSAERPGLAAGGDHAEVNGPATGAGHAEPTDPVVRAGQGSARVQPDTNPTLIHSGSGKSG